MSLIVAVLALIAAGLAGIVLNLLTNVIENIANSYPSFRFQSRWFKLILYIILFIIFSVPAIYSALPEPIQVLNGDFNIVLTPFVVTGEGEGTRNAVDLSTNISNSMSDKFSTLTTGMETKYNVKVVGPNGFSPIAGKNEVLRAQEADKLADKIRADIVIYGIIEVTKISANINLEFYLANNNFDSVINTSVQGQYQVSPIFIDDISNLVTRKAASDTLTEYAEILWKVVQGLLESRDDKYVDAELSFSEALSTTIPISDSWKNNDLLYVFLGNSILKQAEKLGKENNTDAFLKSMDKLSQAKSSYQSAIGLNNQFSRAYIGIGSTYYLLAIGDPRRNDYSKIDLAELDNAIKAYEKAKYIDGSIIQIPFADISAKANFGLGQSLFSKMLKSEFVAIDTSLALTVDERQMYHNNALDAVENARLAFCAVIDDYWSQEHFSNVSSNQCITELITYTKGAIVHLQIDDMTKVNSRIQELAAHSYARLGTTEIFVNQSKNSILLYDYALALLPCLNGMNDYRSEYGSQIKKELLKDSTMTWKNWLQQKLEESSCQLQKKWVQQQLSQL